MLQFFSFLSGIHCFLHVEIFLGFYGDGMFFHQFFVMILPKSVAEQNTQKHCTDNANPSEQFFQTDENGLLCNLCVKSLYGMRRQAAVYLVHSQTEKSDVFLTQMSESSGKNGCSEWGSYTGTDKA